MIARSQFAIIISTAAGLSFLLPAQAAEPDNQFIIQQQRQKALEQQLTPPVPDVRLSEPSSSFGKIAFPVETPCFPIRNVSLTGQDALPRWLPLQRIADQAQGRCLGGKGINLLMSTMQNRLVDHGWITTRVLAPTQDLKSGTLKLAIVPGYIRHVRLTEDSDDYIQLYTSFPAHEGNLLDLRDIEQGLENLQRLPTVEASMEIVPGEQPGESDVVITRKQSKMWRLGLSLDDAGTETTGRYQGGVTLSLDNPFSLSDLLYVSASHDLNDHGGKGSKNYTGHYSVPFGYWTLGVTGSDYDYHQTVAGQNQDYRYSGKSKNLDVQLSRVLHRSGSQKTTLTADVLARETRNYVDDTEVGVQRRQTAGWRLGLQHRHYIGQASVDAGVSYQRGTRWFGAQPAPEEAFGEATALSKILQLNAQLDLPFEIGSQHFRYNVQYLRQISNTPLTPQDQFAIGNRWTVRGFDGERTLNASHGWYVRNDLGWSTPLPNQELYLGADYGEVGGYSSDPLIGKHLAGGVVGLRGSAFNTGYDLFAGTPFSKPDGFHTSSLTLGFNLNWSW
ncbi:ShlB/FhaC/HecB family hemolysin secretion/activation protein [Lelliottia sp. F153]|uniref:ShlB/FhaC/HecB family hemolysin secretion/activation protein n=1 Tax=unclassified Lelliottia TaxID=2642424 RepID=UPI000C7F590F|nr:MULTISPECIES: ShlB/FhaC/HecB family hemolysin secretion/activation protein [unclassified Lelliottia]PLY43892.1 ShlB/FhaC/HecB family hemolysin secretion/activation protein [Lelliottia sp. F159]PLY49190.1 ShlB/FhaC/HecB family hemolysin secretion/activation protein [Lelliottia sp. F154]PLY53332.1 ShlB/FhaC/HecB family hemolysin secretion/activation protein [Lelliottia sp. F153]